MRPLSLLFLLPFLLIGCAQAKFTVDNGIGKLAVPFAFPESQKQKFTRQLELVYVDMPKTELYKIFKSFQQSNYRRQGNKEWITFSTRGAGPQADTITFYLLNNKVKQWQKPD